MPKKVLIRIDTPALGDTLCGTPTVRKAFQSYGRKLYIQSGRPDVFERSPYVEKVYHLNDKLDLKDFDEIYDTYNPDVNIRGRKINIKLSNFEARQLHALGLGLTLYPEEMHYDYFPGEQTKDSKQIDKNCLVFHITDNWPNRTWPKKSWERLTSLVKTHTNYKIVTIGKSHTEDTAYGKMAKNIWDLSGIDYNFCDGVAGGQDHKSQYRPINELWHVLNNAKALISFDAGPVHFAGTTDTHIIQIGASIDPRKTAPYRKGTQDYKFKFVGGDCKLFCATNPKYSVMEHGTINNLPYLPECLERYPKFYCQPSPDQVFFEILNLTQK
jgi:ADP-heptose:LPS heptosyltransferase